MKTEILEILSLAARALVLLLRQAVPKKKRSILLTRRDDDSDPPYQDLWTGRGFLRMRKVRSRK